MLKFIVPVFIFAVCESSISYAEKMKMGKRSHEAHVHGAATLNIAFDGLKGKVDFTGAAEGVVGFEHAATTPADKKKLANTVQIFEKNISDMILFDSSLKCQFSKEKVEMRNGSEGEAHSNFIAQFSVQCAKPVDGSKVSFSFSQFPQLKDVDITFLVGALQKSLEYKGTKVTLELK